MDNRFSPDCEALEHGISCEFLDSVSSTNSYLIERVDSVKPYHFVATTHQFGGKGRMGRAWESGSGLGLAFSIVLPAGEGHTAAGIYPLLVGSAVLDLVREIGLPQAQLKWPNDVLVLERKLAGVLCELNPAPVVIAGVGINIFHDNETLPHPNATSLLLEGIQVSDWRAFAVGVAEKIQATWERMQEIQSNWSGHWETRMGTIGQAVTVEEVKKRVWEGQALSINPEGHLLVQRFDDDSIERVVAADIWHLRQ